MPGDRRLQRDVCDTGHRLPAANKLQARKVCPVTRPGTSTSKSHTVPLTVCLGTAERALCPAVGCSSAVTAAQDDVAVAAAGRVCVLLRKLEDIAARFVRGFRLDWGLSY